MIQRMRTLLLAILFALGVGSLPLVVMETVKRPILAFWGLIVIVVGGLACVAVILIRRRRRAG